MTTTAPSRAGSWREAVAPLRAAARAMAAQDPDRAEVDNSVGYSKADGSFGHALAALPEERWDEEITWAAWTMLRAYSRSQLPAAGINFATIPVPPPSERRVWKIGPYGSQQVLAGREKAREAVKSAASGTVIDFDGQEFQVRFERYDPILVTEVKAIPGRSYRSGVNYIPRSSVSQLHSFAAKHNIPFTDKAKTVPVLSVVKVEDGAQNRVILKDGELAVRFGYPLDFALKDSLKMSVGPKWDSDDRLWKLPLQVAEAAKLRAWATDNNVDIDPEANSAINQVILDAAEAVAASKALDAELEVPGMREGLSLYPFQRAGVKYALDRWNKDKRGVIIGDDMGLGKGGRPSDKILTPWGWTTYGQIKSGDWVVGSRGEPTQVIGVYPRGVLPVYRVSFSDGTSVVVDGDHLWQVNTALGNHRDQFGEVLSTLQIQEQSLIRPNGNSVFFIPMVEPVQFARGPRLPIDPYVLGLLLGDGSFRSGSPVFTSGDPDLLEALGEALPAGLKLVPASDRMDAVRIIQTQRTRSGNPLIQSLKARGLWGKAAWEKYIPDEYLYASVEDRLALLQGLLDTDGNGRPDSVIEFTVTSTDLAKGTQFLVESLGGTAVWSERDPWYYDRKGARVQCRRAYRLHITLPVGSEAPFRLARKLGMWRPNEKYGPSRAIVAVEPAGVDEVICIAVAAPDRLYVTEHCIVTHNTSQGLAAVVLADTFPAVLVVPNIVMLNWPREIEKFFPGYTWQLVSGTKRAPVKTGVHFTIVPYSIIGDRWEDVAALHPKALVADESHYIKNGQMKYRCPDCGAKVPKANSVTCENGACRVRFKKDGLRPEVFWSVVRTHGVLSLARSMAPGSLKLALTGTAITNRPGELVNQLTMIDRIDEFGGAWRFLRDFCGSYQTGFGYDTSGASRERELHEKLRMSSYVRREKTEVNKELPPRQHIPVELTVAPSKRAHYDKVEADVIEYVADRARRLAEEAGGNGEAAYWEKRLKAEAAEHLVRISALKRAATEAKMEAVFQWIDMFLETNPDEKLIVFGELIDVVEGLAARYGDLAVKVRGGVNPEDRMKAVDRFQGDPKCRLFVGNMASANVGLTLTAASNVAFVELAWTPADHDQAIDRANARVDKGIENMRPAAGHYLLLPDSIDDEIDALLKAKRIVTQAVLDGKGDKAQVSVLGDLLVRLAHKGLDKDSPTSQVN